MSLDVSRIVAVDISVSPLALQSAGFGILNIVGKDSVIPLTERVRAYDNITGVAEDWATTTEEYIAATLYFSQSPRPSQVYISRRVDVDSNATLFGSSVDVTSTIATWAAISDGEVDVTIDTGVINLTALDFSTDTTMTLVATRISAALGAGATATWSLTDERFEIVNDDTAGVTSTIAYVTDPAGAGTYIGALMGCEAADTGVYIDAGTDAETIPESLNAIEAINSKWYGFGFTKEVRDATVTSAGTLADCIDAATWAEARTKLFCNNSGDVNCLVSTDTTNIAYQIDQLGYSRTLTVYNAGDYPAVSAFARGATVDFAGTDTAITYKFKQMPGITPTDLSASQANALIDFNCNYYASFGTQLSGDSVAIFAEGVVGNGRFIDEVVGIDWLQNEIQTTVFNYLYQSLTKIPQTDEGVAGIQQALEKVLDQAVNNGLAAAGYVTIDGNDVFLDKGYLVFTTLVEDQSQADREARKAPPISFIIKGAGAIHSVTITGTFVR